MKTLYKTLMFSAAALVLAPAAYAEGTTGDSAARSDSMTQSNTSAMNRDNTALDDNYNAVTGEAQTEYMNDNSNDSASNQNVGDEDMNQGQTAMDADRTMQNRNIQYGSLNTDEVRDLQSSLRSEGYNIAVDGIWGENTTAAIREFQRDNNLDVTGQLDAGTLSQLDVDLDSSYNR